MPKKLINDYIFYKIVCLDNTIELCYVGSTSNWKARNHQHKSICNNENSKNYNTKIYKTIREYSGWSNFKMIQIGKREQLTKREAEQIEEEYRVELKANMNMKKCFRTEEQKQKWYEENKDKIKEQKQNYYEENKDKFKNYNEENKYKIKERHQKWYEENKDKIKEYNEENKDKFKQYQQNYYEENKDKLLCRTNKYNEENKDKIKEKQLQKVKCDCGCVVSKINLSTHKKSPKHIKLMNQNLIN